MSRLKMGSARLKGLDLLSSISRFKYGTRCKIWYENLRIRISPVKKTKKRFPWPWFFSALIALDCRLEKGYGRIVRQEADG